MERPSRYSNVGVSGHLRSGTCSCLAFDFISFLSGKQTEPQHIIPLTTDAKSLRTPSAATIIAGESCCEVPRCRATESRQQLKLSVKAFYDREFRKHYRRTSEFSISCGAPFYGRAEHSLRKLTISHQTARSFTGAELTSISLGISINSPASRSGNNGS